MIDNLLCCLIMTSLHQAVDGVREANRLDCARGSIQKVTEIPKEMRDVYKTVWEIPQRCILDMAADRGAFICQSQSMNVHLGEPSTSKLTSMHFYAWKKGLKTGMYYLRTRPKADAIQFTVDQGMVADRAKAKSESDEKSGKTSPTSVTSKPEAPASNLPLMTAKIAGLEVKDEADECLNCGA